MGKAGKYRTYSYVGNRTTIHKYFRTKKTAMKNQRTLKKMSYFYLLLW